MSNIERTSHFYNDEKKMRDFAILSKEDFLNSYSYLSEEEYDNTATAVKYQALDMALRASDLSIEKHGERGFRLYDAIFNDYATCDSEGVEEDTFYEISDIITALDSTIEEFASDLEEELEESGIKVEHIPDSAQEWTDFADTIRQELSEGKLAVETDEKVKFLEEHYWSFELLRLAASDCQSLSLERLYDTVLNNDLKMANDTIENLKKAGDSKNKEEAGIEI